MFELFDLFLYGTIAVVLIPIVLVGVVLAHYFNLRQSFAHAGRKMGVRWWDAAGPFVAVVGIFAATWLLGNVPAEGESGRTLFVVSGVFVCLGAMGLSTALGNLDEYRQLSAGVDSAGTVDAGPTALSGTANAYEGTPTAPLSGESALAHTLRITERRGLIRKHSVDVHYEQSTDLIELDDGTGAVVVDPTDGAIRLGSDRVGSDSRLSTPVEESETATRTRLDRLRDRLGYEPTDDRRYEEMRLDPGTKITVLGSVRRDPELRYPAVEDGDRRLVLFEGEADAVLTRVSGNVKLGTVAGVLATVGGTAGLLLTAGVL